MVLEVKVLPKNGGAKGHPIRMVLDPPENFTTSPWLQWSHLLIRMWTRLPPLPSGASGLEPGTPLAVVARLSPELDAGGRSASASLKQPVGGGGGGCV